MSKFKNICTITKELLTEIYSLKTARDQKYEILSKTISDLTGGDFKNTVYDFDGDKIIDLALETLLGEELFEDWGYLLYECAKMDGGGSITVDGQKYRIRNVDDLWFYWEQEGLIAEDI